MNPPSMETIFLLLSGVILFAGVLYWFWSHLQLTQKKVQLLENAVFELRGMLASRPDTGGGTVISGSGAPEAAYKDLTDDEDLGDLGEREVEWADEENASEGEVAHLQVEKIVDTPDEQAEEAQAQEETDALQPGGRIQAPDVVEVEESAIGAEKFLTMFAADEGSAAPPASGSQSLEGMPVRELRRLAEERSIKNAEAMKKKELLAALRAQAGTATLDLTSMGVVVNKEEVPVLE
jgi:hypothetical protein